MYNYGMKLRGFSIGCQPKGVIEWKDTNKAEQGFYSIITYDRELTPEEIEAYDLTNLNAEMKICSECGREMIEGYCIENGLDYYCSDECLHKNMTEEEYLELYDDGNGDSYYTEWSEWQWNY